MPGRFAAVSLILLVFIVVARVLWLRSKGVRAMSFGKTDRSDFLIPPFAALYLYLVFAAAFGWPTVSRQIFFRSKILGWIGVLFCLAGLVMLLWSLISFGKSFRVGIDNEHPDQLVTTGIFAVSRNPIYVGFATVLVGQFLVFPNWILLVYLLAAAWLFHRQVLREEAFLKAHYGRDYAEYCGRVGRYL